MCFYPDIGVSDNPLLSRGYADCNGVVLIGSTYSGMSHFSFSSKIGWNDTRRYMVDGSKGEDVQIDPKKYLNHLLLKLKQKGEIEGLQAVLIGGDRDHFNHNKKFLLERGIKIIGSYVDGWQNDTSNDSSRIGPKDLLVVPKTREVIMFSEPIGYLQLSPKT